MRKINFKKNYKYYEIYPLRKTTSGFLDIRALKKLGITGLKLVIFGCFSSGLRLKSTFNVTQK
jgi:hypothetical protein